MFQSSFFSYLLSALAHNDPALDILHLVPDPGLLLLVSVISLKVVLPLDLSFKPLQSLFFGQIPFGVILGRVHILLILVVPTVNPNIGLEILNRILSARLAPPTDR